MKPFNADELLTRYVGLDRGLQAKGFPATSTWWWREIQRWARALASGRRQWVLRVGRRGGKSSTLCRLAVAWALFGAWRVPPGDRGVVAFVSVSLDEARQRLRTIQAILDALGVRYEKRGDEIELVDRPAVFRAYACTVSAVVGFTAIAIIGDEVARWESRESMANPAAHVIGTLRPTLATQPLGFTVLSSSPWTVDDYHAEAFELGDTDHQLASFAESWIANPTLTEAGTRSLEPHEPTWRREYAAIPMASAGSPFFPEESIERSTDVGRVRPGQIDPDIRYIVAADQAFVGRDRFGVAVVSHEVGPLDTLGNRLPPRVVVHECYSWLPQGQPSVDAQRLASLAHRYGTRTIYVDQGGGGIVFADLLRGFNAHAEVVHWTGGEKDGSKLDRYRRVRTGMLEGSVRLPDSPDLQRELRSIQSELAPSGTERIIVKRSAHGHADAATALILAVSLAVERVPQLPVNRETPWEQRERALRERAMQELFARLG